MSDCIPTNFHFGRGRLQSTHAAFLADRQAVAQWAKTYQASRPDASFEYGELTLVRYLLMSGDVERVPSVLRPLLDTAQREGRLRASMEIKLLLNRRCLNH